MSDPVQAVPPSAVAVPRATPVRQDPPPVEPPKKSQTDNRGSNDHREAERRAAIEADREMSITRDENLNGFVYRSIEVDSGDVVWQFPAEELLRRAEHLRQMEEKRLEERAREVDEKA
jgi:uncharacterized FlaG/YvyC family protein